MENSPRKQPLVILGSGATALVTAAYLTSQGHPITLCDLPPYQPVFEQLTKQKGILLRGASGVTGLKNPYCITHDIQQALSHSYQVLVCTSAGRHQSIAQWCAPFLTPEHCVLLVPGNAGSILMRHIFEEMGVSEKTIVGEISDNLWACRVTGPGEVLAALPIKPKKAAAYRCADTPKLIQAFEPFFPLLPAANILETTLNSPNVITHVVGSVLNAVQIENRGSEFAFFQHGLSRSVIDCTQAVEDERDRILRHLGLTAYGKVTALSRKLLLEPEHQGFQLFRQLDGPDSLSHRYISEDASCGMALLVSIAIEYNLPCPMSNAALAFASCFHNVDYLAVGRTLKNLKLSGYSVPQLLSLL